STKQTTDTVEEEMSPRASGSSGCLVSNMREPSEMPSGGSSSEVSAIPSCSTDATLEGTPRQKRERKPQKPGKYVCSYCGRASAPSCSTDEALEGTPSQKRERKPQKPGKYVCSYCGRACAKPSVLQKHIRSHTGERPYPCAPCGFSFKTKSNLYKHRKSHTHRGP
uniref:C2H2-type domain-containing protein n=1 Tax=Sinocyclocheilus rhinocerous TaxID=307959 RepID=A0A673FWU7_9TELE